MSTNSTNWDQGDIWSLARGCQNGFTAQVIAAMTSDELRQALIAALVTVDHGIRRYGAFATEVAHAAVSKGHVLEHVAINPYETLQAWSLAPGSGVTYAAIQSLDYGEKDSMILAAVQMLSFAAANDPAIVQDWTALGNLRGE